AMEFFQTAGRNLTAAEVAAGVKHHVALSVVGTERLQASGYFRAKQAQENLIKSSPIAYTLIHATQFFEFVRAIAQFSTDGNTVRLPPVLFQPMAAADVSTAVAEAALAQPVNGMVEIAGPDTFTLDEAVRKVLEYDHDARKVIADPAAPYYGAKVSEKTLGPGGRRPPRLDQVRLVAHPRPAAEEMIASERLRSSACTNRREQPMLRMLCLGVAVVMGVAAVANGLFMLVSPEHWYFSVPGVT